MCCTIQPMRRIAMVAACLCLLFACTGPRFPHLDECPDPMMESMSWRSVEGTAVDVGDDLRFRLKTDEGRTVGVTIANVGAAKDGRAVPRLRRMLQGRRVTVLVNPSFYEDPEITGEVHAGNVDVGHQLLAEGLVAFVREEGYTISGYSECLNRIAATKR